MRKQLGRYGATDEEQAAFARKHPGELVICLTLPAAEAELPAKPESRRAKK